jgi:cytochrome c peroxidase
VEGVQIGQETYPLNLPNNIPLPNPHGASATSSVTGSIDFENEFFQDFGTNDRTCVHCHVPSEGWGVSAKGVQLRFLLTGGTDPIFRTVDGSNSPNADVSSVRKRKAAYSMLLNRGTIRVGIGIPANAEFELIAVDDPYGFASATELSLFRKPLPSATLNFASSVMWDGRETITGDLFGSLAQQSNHATLGHAQAAAPLSSDEQAAIVNFETGIFAAQVFDFDAGWLDEDGAHGGPDALAAQARVAAPFNLFDAWTDLPGTDDESLAREAIARGQALFNGTNAGGGSCRGCHNLSNLGTSANPIFFDINISDAEFHQPDFPLYTLRNLTTGEIKETSDPGRALITGRWNDVGRFKAPLLRSLASRAPYFHNGIAATLDDVVDFYEQSLGFIFTEQEQADLVAFLKAL